ncbi:unnamed protein product [Caenorhabditis nigoni]
MNNHHSISSWFGIVVFASMSIILLLILLIVIKDQLNIAKFHRYSVHMTPEENDAIMAARLLRYHREQFDEDSEISSIFFIA